MVNYHTGDQQGAGLADDVPELVAAIAEECPGVQVLAGEAARSYEREADAATSATAQRLLDAPEGELRQVLRAFERQHYERRSDVRETALLIDNERRREQLNAATGTGERVRVLRRAATDYGLDESAQGNQRIRVLRRGRPWRVGYALLWWFATNIDARVRELAPDPDYPIDPEIAHSFGPEVAEVVGFVATAAGGAVIDRLIGAALAWFRGHPRRGGPPRVVRIYGPTGRVLRSVRVPPSDADDSAADRRTFG